MTSYHNSKDKSTATYSSIPQEEEHQQRDDNNEHNERKKREETVALLEVDSHTVTIAMTDCHDDNNQDDYFSKTCRICGEGEEEDDDTDKEESDNDEDNERRLYSEQTTMPSSSTSYPTEQQKTPSNQQKPKPKPKPKQRQRQRQRQKKSISNNYDNPLIRPCKCKGSMMYVHIDCLNRWRELSPRQESYVACDLCGYRYNMYRPKFAAIVSHAYFLKSISLFMIVLLTIGMAYVCKWIHVYLILQHQSPSESPPNDDNSDNDSTHDDGGWWEHGGAAGPMILGLNRIYLLAGLISVSMFGIIYLVYCCTTQSSAVTDNSNGAASPLLPMGSTSGWLCCCDNDSSTLYGCYIADFTTCSGDAALGGIIVFIAFVILATIVFGILGVFSGIYALIESIVQHVAGRVKERILDVHDDLIITS